MLVWLIIGMFSSWQASSITFLSISPFCSYYLVLVQGLKWLSWFFSVIRDLAVSIIWFDAISVVSSNERSFFRHGISINLGGSLFWWAWCSLPYLCSLSDEKGLNFAVNFLLMDPVRRYSLTSFTILSPKTNANLPWLVYKLIRRFLTTVFNITTIK